MYNQKVYCIVIVVPYQDMVDMAKEAFEEHNQREIREGTAKQGEYTYRVIFHGDYEKDILPAVEDADAVIARGIMYHVLARKLGARVVSFKSAPMISLLFWTQLKRLGLTGRSELWGLSTCSGMQRRSGKYLGYRLRTTLLTTRSGRR